MEEVDNGRGQGYYIVNGWTMSSKGIPMKDRTIAFEIFFLVFSGFSPFSVA